MIRPLLPVLPVLAIAGGLHAQTADVPPPTPVASFPMPAPQEALLPGGLRLVVLEQHRQPTLSIRLSIPAGTVFDPNGKEGLADLYAALLTRGAGGRTGPEVAAAIEGVGGTFGAAAGPDFLMIQADVISKDAALAFELVGDAVLRPTLSQDDLNLLRDQSTRSVLAGLEEPGSLAARVFLLAAYRGHPYGRRASPASLQAISRADLEAFRRSRIRPAGSAVVVAGDITLAAARQLVTRHLGTWTGLRAPALAPKALPPARKEILLVHAGGVQNASLLVGATTFAGADTGYYGVALLSQMLGAGPSSRLAQALGGDRQWAAASGASYLRTSRLGLFQATVTVPVEVADSALGVMYSELDRLRTTPVPPAELDRARENLAGSYALRLQSMGQLAGAVAEAQLFSLPVRYLSTYRSRILGVTALQVRAAARRVLPVQGLVTVVVGDATKLYQSLGKRGTVRIFSSDGRPLTPESIEPKTIPFALAVSQAPTRIDTLAVLAQGRSVGYQVTRLSRSGDSVAYVEETSLGTMFTQTTTLTFDTLGQMRNLNQTGKSRGQDTRIQLSYGGGRVRGQATVATLEGPRSFSVDTTVPPTIIDDNGVQAILPMLPWDINVRWTFDVFASGENLVRRMTLTASDLTQLTVPAGTFDCYRADLEGGPQRVSFFVTAKAPHRVVRVEIANSPIEFVAVNP